jgi:hypothetical protein
MPDEPGGALGASWAAAAREGRDKLTCLLPPRLDRFALWIEQLVAEKHWQKRQRDCSNCGRDPEGRGCRRPLSS